VGLASWNGLMLQFTSHMLRGSPYTVFATNSAQFFRLMADSKTWQF